MSDVFSGYGKATTDSNNYRRENHLPLIHNLYCDAHARRKFVEAAESFEKQSALFLWCYRRIYHLEDHQDFKTRGQWQQIYYRAMEKNGARLKFSYSEKSSLVMAINYLIKNFDGLTHFLNRNDLPIDNNSQERLMGNPVIGRRPWPGTHSRQEAETNAVLFSLIESFKINKVNPRDYFREIVHSIPKEIGHLHSWSTGFQALAVFNLNTFILGNFTGDVSHTFFHGIRGFREDKYRSFGM